MLEIGHVHGPFDVGCGGEVRDKLGIQFSARQRKLPRAKCDGILPAAQPERDAGKIGFRLPIVHAHRIHGKIVQRDGDSLGIGGRRGRALDDAAHAISASVRLMLSISSSDMVEDESLGFGVSVDVNV